MCPRDLGHSTRGRVKMRINPAIARIEPHFPVAPIPPTRRTRLQHLLRGLGRQKFARRRQREFVLIANGFANKELKKARSLEPPVSK